MSEKKKVYIDKDEWYPCYDWKPEEDWYDSEYFKKHAIEVDQVTIERWETISKSFHELQRELMELYYKAHKNV
jgi:hypothetical protein